MSVKVGEIWDTVPGSGLCVSPVKEVRTSKEVRTLNGG